MSGEALTTPQTFRAFMERPTFQEALLGVLGGDQKQADRLKRVAIQAVARQPELQECTTLSIAEAVMQAGELGLEPGSSVLAFCYLIPRKHNDSKEMRATLQVSYRGKIELSRRSGLVQKVEAHEVRANDRFAVCLGSEPKLTHELVVSELHARGPVIGYYAVAFFVGGGFQFEVMSWQQIDQHRQQYSGANNKAWNTAFDEMAKKTVVHRLEKYLPLSPVQILAHDRDEESDTYLVRPIVSDEKPAAANDSPAGGAAPAAGDPPASAAPAKKRSTTLAKAREAAEAREVKREDPARERTAESTPAASADTLPADGPGPCEKTEGCLLPTKHLGECRPPMPDFEPSSADGSSFIRCTLTGKCPATLHQEGCPAYLPRPK